MRIRMMGAGLAFEVQEVGILHAEGRGRPELSVGEVGYVIAGIKDLHATKIGDTMTEAERPTAEAFPGFLDVKTDGLRVALPDRLGGLREPAGCDGKAPSERRLLHVRA